LSSGASKRALACRSWTIHGTSRRPGGSQYASPSPKSSEATSARAAIALVTSAVVTSASARGFDNHGNDWS
jgi:hypothetical protein